MKPTLQHLQSLPAKREFLTPIQFLAFDKMLNNLWKIRETRSTRYESQSSVSQKKKRILRRRNQRH